MSAFAKLFSEIFRNFVNDGVPSSGVHKPSKEDIRAWGATVESAVTLASRTVTDAGDITVVAGDVLIIVRKAVGEATVISLPASTDFTGRLVIKDGKGDAGTNNITITPDGAELIDGLSTVVISTNFGSAELTPDPDGGWLLLNFG